MIRVVKLKKIIFFVGMFLIIFAILYYKNYLFGNNINKNRIENILENMNNYKAEMKVTIKSNKTENSYLIKQEVNDNYSMQEVLDGENVKGLRIELNDGKLKISNTNLNLEKIYENYEDLLNNALFLNTFSADYKNTENTIKYIEKEDEIILEVELKKNQNTYIKHKKLYIDKKTKLPQKLEIKADSQRETICILYNNIEKN